MINPIVTSSGNRILSPISTNLPLPAIGNIFIANARLTQNPAPPVANQNLTFLLRLSFFGLLLEDVVTFVISDFGYKKKKN